MKYLNNIRTLEELKKEYRKWAMKLHPDHGGSNAEMKVLNSEYAALFDKVKNIHTNKDGETYHKESSEAPEDFVRIVDELMKLYGIRIEIVGSFLWVSGETKPHKAVLKKLGMKWHSKKECWFLAPEGYRRHGGREYSMDEIRSMYGVSFDEETSREDARRRELQRA